MASGLAAGPLRQRLSRAVDELDETIRQIRTSIFALRDARVSVASVRDAALDLVAELAPVLGFRPDVSFSGPLDTLVDDRLVDDVTAVLREALTNVAKHAQARRAGVVVALGDGRLRVEVFDDGVGIVGPNPRSGLANLRARAEQHGGALDVDSRDEGGLRLEWTIPLLI
jgi:signal transduction histidine kinase